MTDHLATRVRADGLLRAVAVQGTETAQEICRRHNLHGDAALLMARAVVSTALLSVLEKDDARLTLQWASRGPFGVVHADLRPGLLLRAYLSGEAASTVVPSGSRPSLGPGVLVVMRQVLGQPILQGQVPLAGGEVDLDVEAYLRRSEQVPSVLRAFVSLDASGAIAAAAGALVQCLPGGDPKDIEPGAGIDAAYFSRTLPADLDAATLLMRVLPSGLGGSTVAGPLRFGCTCSRARVEASVAMLGVEELLGMVAAGEGTSVRCEFCAEDYVVGVEDLLRLLTVMMDAPEAGSA